MRKTWITTTIVLLFIAGQFHSNLHAAEFGGDVHYHDGVACTAVLPEDEHDTAAPSQTCEPRFYRPTKQTKYSNAQSFVSSLVGILPPPHGPPVNA